MVLRAENPSVKGRGDVSLKHHTAQEAPGLSRPLRWPR